MLKADLPDDTLMTPAEVADAFRVRVEMVGRWRRKGLLTSVDTPGGAKRYRASEVHALLHGVREGAGS